MERLNWNITVAALCLCVVAVPLVQAETETDYMAILLQDKKIGHAVHSRAVEGDKVITTDDVMMTLGRGGQAVSIKSKEVHTETLDGQPLGFEMTLVTSGVEQKTTGTVSDGKAHISRQIMGQAQQMTIDWPEGTLLNEGLRQAQIKRGLTEGDTFDVALFRPDLLMTVDASLKVGKKLEVELLDGPAELTHVTIVMTVGEQKIEMVSYVDSDMKAMKTKVPMMGMELEMIVCEKAFATQDDDLVDFLDKLNVASPLKLVNLHSVASAEYLLKPAKDKVISLPSSSNQDVDTTDAGVVVKVTPLTADKGVSFPYAGDDPEILAAMKPNEYMQSDNSKVVDLAKSAVGETKDAALAAEQIEAFVDGYINQKDLSVGYASAAEVAQTRQGDCSEHAVLAAAMCRAVGIPARTVCGIVYADTFLSRQSIFGGHMWVEVYIGDKWIGLDATRSQQRGYGPGHIAMAYGDGAPTDFFGLVNTLGCFEIEKITLSKKEAVKEKTKQEKTE